MIVDKSRFVTHLAERAEMSHAKAEASLNTTLDLLAAMMTTGDSVRFKGFGTFSVKQRAGRSGRNVHTGAHITVPPRRVAHFKPSVNLKDLVAKTEPDESIA